MTNSLGTRGFMIIYNSFISGVGAGVKHSKLWITDVIETFGNAFSDTTSLPSQVLYTSHITSR